MNQKEDQDYQDYLQRKKDEEEYYEGLRVVDQTQNLLAERDRVNLLKENIGEFNPEALLADGLDNALIGYSTTGLAIYSVGKIIEVFMERDGMSREDATDFFHFNVEGAYVGEYTPIYMYEE
jgi:hypothetical protein